MTKEVNNKTGTLMRTCFVVGSPCWARTSDIMINSHPAPQHSRPAHLDAMLTLNEPDSLFRLSPIEKQHLVVFLGPSLYRAVGIAMTVKQNIVGLSRSERKNKREQPFGYSLLFGSPCWARTSDIMINSHALYRLS